MRSHARLLPFAWLFAATGALADDAFVMKVGQFNLTHDSQHIGGVQREIDEGARNVYAFAWENRRSDGAGFGLEFIRLDNEWRTRGNTEQGEVTSRVLLFNAKRYVQTGTVTFPFLGMGAGLTYTDGSGNNTDSGTGIALQLSTGVEFRWQMVGLHAEVKGLYAESGLIGDEFNNSGIGVFVGATLMF